MRKSIKIGVIVVVLLSICLCTLMLAGCGDKAKPPYYVRLDVYKPDGELVVDPYSSSTARLSLKYDGNPKVLGIKVYSKGQERYINDDDISRGNLNSAIRVSIKHGESNEHFPIYFEDDNSWPTEVGYYDIIIRFNIPVGVGSVLDENYRIADKRIYLTIEEA